jgi:L-amino acid N-acyltransferase YncA/predicted nucleic acid-binding protein
MLDTNVFIPVEPTSIDGVEPLTAAIAELERVAVEHGNGIVVHPELYRDIQRDTDEGRRRLRVVLASKYARLRKPPPISESMKQVLGEVTSESHDWIDHHLLAAVVENAVDFLVTEDNDLHRKAEQMQVAQRVLHVADALEMLDDLYQPSRTPPPAVVRTSGRHVDLNDHIFDSLRSDYPEFDAWFARAVQGEDRIAWVVEGLSAGYAGICIIKEESPDESDLYGHTLKVCTFKVADEHGGFRYGESLLKVLFDHAEACGYEWLYLTVKPDKDWLIEWLSEFGFENTGSTRKGDEVRLCKKRAFTQADLDATEPYDFHVRFGPPAVKSQGAPAFIAPIIPVYHERLFPETPQQQMNLLAGHEAHGNGLRKAYLCRSNTRSIRKGDLLYFYRSQHDQGVTAVGVVEEVHPLSDPRAIVQAVGKRTLYTLEEIVEMTEGGTKEVLAISFRQAKVLPSPIATQLLTQHGVIAAPPQNTQSIPQGGAEWIAQQVFP